MPILRPSLRVTALCVGAALAAGCALSATPTPIQQSLESKRSLSAPLGLNVLADSLSQPVLLAANTATGALEYWPISPTGGKHPLRLANLHLSPAYAMAANGNVVAIANQNPPEVILYDVATKAKSTLPDPYGEPLDIAIDKHAALYVINFANPTGNVAMYPAGSPQPRELVCKYIDVGEAIAVDNEGDIFVNGYGHGRQGVVEIPNGPSGPDPENCTKLRLKREPGYVAGLAVDPKTDDLLVLDNPDLCAGGREGRLTIYPKPYAESTGRSHELGANCAGQLRLDATSSIVFVGDQTVSGGYAYVLQRSYPDGRDLGTYNGGNPGGITTIPNTLPN